MKPPPELFSIGILPRVTFYNCVREYAEGCNIVFITADLFQEREREIESDRERVRERQREGDR